MKPAKQERPLWVQAVSYAIKGLLMFGVGLGLTLAAVTAVLANQATLHEKFCHPLEYVSHIEKAVLNLIH